MRLLAAALLTLLPAAAGAVSSPQSPPLKAPVTSHALPPTAADCPQTARHFAFDPDEPLIPRKLTELPAANMYAAVFRHIGKCEVPLIVKYGVGGR